VGAGVIEGVDFDEDAMDAGLNLIGRTGAKDLEIGYANDDAVLARDGDWYAVCSYAGAKIMEEHHIGPVEAVDTLARRLLTGGKCTHCGGLIALSDKGAVAFEDATLLDGTRMTAERYAAMPQCRWRRMGKVWERGCLDRFPERQGPTRRERRGKGRRR
jgi:hypothetical protein